MNFFFGNIVSICWSTSFLTLVFGDPSEMLSKYKLIIILEYHYRRNIQKRLCDSHCFFSGIAVSTILAP